MKRCIWKNLIIIGSIIFCNNYVFADSESVDVSAPSAVSSDVKSKGTIIAPATQYEYSPINDKPPGFVQSEYDLVNNYTINLETIRLRIKYFSADYIYQKSSIMRSTEASEMQRGKTGSYTVNMLDETNTTLKSALDSLTKETSYLVINYLQEKYKVQNEEEKLKITKKIHDLAVEDNKNGLIDAITLNKYFMQYQESEEAYTNDVKTLENTLKSIATRLGYKNNEIEKLVFLEPDVNVVKFSNYVSANGFEKYLGYDTNYVSVLSKGMDTKDKKLPGSTGEKLYNQNLEDAKQLAVVNYNNYLTNFNVAVIKYNNTENLKKIIDITKENVEASHKANLLSDIEYYNNLIEINNLNYNLQKLKYDLLKAYYDYYYVTLSS